jgi:hypothetical protein
MRNSTRLSRITPRKHSTVILANRLADRLGVGLLEGNSYNSGTGGQAFPRMTKLHHAWSWLLQHVHSLWLWSAGHRTDIYIAAFFALVFGLIIDLLSIGSRIRAGVRHIGNKFSERSQQSLLKRIQQLQRKRDHVLSFVGSDKALYMRCFQFVFIILMFLSAGNMMLLMTMAGIASGPRDDPLRAVMVMSTFLFFLAGFFMAEKAMDIARLDSRAKVDKAVEQLDGEIAHLKSKLNA